MMTSRLFRLVPPWNRGTLRFLTGDALAMLRTLPSCSVQMCVTSPPYWGLRDYGTAKWKGGNPACRHSNVRRGHHDEKQSTQKGSSRDRVGVLCRNCGARRIDAQLGLERTPEEYVAKIVQVFREVRRVLRDDGTLWLNLGDSYNAHPGQRTVHDKAGTKQISNRGSNETASRYSPGLKPKDLVGIPWRVAFALQADGWYLRSDIIWAKPNPMPESVEDRPTKAHEYLFLLAKSERYFYDADAIKEPCQPDTPFRYDRGRSEDHKYSDGGPGGQTIAASFEHMRRKSGNLARKTNDGMRCRTNNHLGSSVPWEDTGQGRNKRTVWTVATRPYKGAHFATFPPKLIEPCILAGSRPGDTVLDPFAGAFTTALVSRDLARDFIGIELNPKYVRLGKQRLQSAHESKPLTVALSRDKRQQQKHKVMAA